MKRILSFFLLFFLSLSLYGVDYTEMSTEELIAIMGYVKKPEKDKFLKELNARVDTMTPKEKKEYQKNLKKLKNQKK